MMFSLTNLKGIFHL